MKNTTNAKRILSGLLVLCMLLTLGACSKNSDLPTNGSTAYSSDESTVQTDTQTTGEDLLTDATDFTDATAEPTSVSPDSCAHTYKDATCAAPKTCSKCGATEGSALAHNYKPATCAAPETCSVCGATKGSATPHNWNAATCAAPKTCTQCGATDGSALGHNYMEGKCTVCAHQQENYHALNSGKWTASAAASNMNWAAYNVEIDFTACFAMYLYGEDVNNFDQAFKDELLNDYQQGSDAVKMINGTLYYFGAGGGGAMTYTEQGNTISLSIEGEAKITLERIAGDQLKIVDSTPALPAGMVLTWSAN